MKDLYLQLGLDPGASTADIEMALQAKPELGEAAVILLNEPRRAAYNRTVSTLRSIGILRHRLGLDAESTWFAETYPDFVPRLHIKKHVPRMQPKSETAATLATVNPREKTHRNTIRPWLKVLMMGLVIATVLLLLNAYL